MEKVAAILAEIVGEKQWLTSVHLTEHFNGVADILDPERQVVRRLSLRASFLQNGQRVQEYLRLLPNHVHDHEDHLLFFVRDLIETKGGKMQLVVDLEYVFERRKCVNYVPVINLGMFINLHSRRAAAHFSLMVIFLNTKPL